MAKYKIKLIAREDMEHVMLWLEHVVDQAEEGFLSIDELRDIIAHCKGALGQ